MCFKFKGSIPVFKGFPAYSELNLLNQVRGIQKIPAIENKQIAKHRLSIGLATN